MAKKRLSPKQSTEIAEKIHSFIAEGAHCESHHVRAEENGKYTRGCQWSSGDMAKQKRRNRPAIPMNKVFKVVNAITNREMVERLVPVARGRSEMDTGISDIVNEACRWQRDMALSEQYESMAFRSAGMSGYGCVHKYWDPAANDGNGQIKDEDVPLWEMLWPQRARDMNLSDRRWHVRGKWVTVEEVMGLYGSSRRVRSKLAKLTKSVETETRKGEPAPSVDTAGSPLGGKSGRPTGSAWGWTSVKGGEWVNVAQTEVFVVEAEWKELEYVWEADIPVRFYDWYAFKVGNVPLQIPTGEVDPETGEEHVYSLDPNSYGQMTDEQRVEIRDSVLRESALVQFETMAELNSFMDEWEAAFDGEEFDRYRQIAKTVIRYAIMIDNEIADYGTRPWGWSYYFLTGFPFETRDGMEFYGVVDIVKGAQDYRNALISNMVAIYMASPKDTLAIAKSVGNIQDIADKYSSIGGVLQLPDEVLANWDAKVKQLGGPNFPPQIGPLLDIATDAVETALGLSPIDIGAQGDLRRVSGNVVQSARLAANVVVAVLFDSLRMFRKQYGRCNIKMIHRLYSMDEILRIVGEEKADDIEAIDPSTWDEILNFDVTIDEQPSSPTEQMQVYQTMNETGLMGQMYERGDLALENVLDMTPGLPESIKRKILEGRTLKDQIAQAQEETQKFQAMAQSWYQFAQQTPEGQQVLEAWLRQYEQQTVAQQLFSSPGSQGEPAQPAG